MITSLYIISLVFVWRATGFESFNFFGHYVDIGQIRHHASSSVFSTHSLVACAIIAQRKQQWNNKGVACFGCSGECIAFNGPYSAYPLQNAVNGWSCVGFHPTTQSADNFLAHHKAQELGITLRKADDGMYYFMTTDKKNFDEGKEFCHQVPGFDFPVVITQQQYNVVKGFAQTDIDSHFVGLNNTGDVRNPEWLNGMPYSVTKENTGLNLYSDQTPPVVYHFMWLFGYQFNDIYPTEEQDVLCQANLDGLDWNETI